MEPPTNEAWSCIDSLSARCSTWQLNRNLTVAKRGQFSSQSLAHQRVYLQIRLDSFLMEGYLIASFMLSP